MIQPAGIPGLLEPFGVNLTGSQTDRLLTYLELLLKWNAKINLVGRTTEEDAVSRHFGESLFAANLIGPVGRLLDIGSGAGFPGLVLKITCPKLEVTLLEPVAKKRAFLKEAARVCQFGQVTVLGDRIEDIAPRVANPQYDYATSRAVAVSPQLIENAARCLRQAGKLCLWQGRENAARIINEQAPFKWRQPVPIPLSRERVILIGELLSSP